MRKLQLMYLLILMITLCGCGKKEDPVQPPKEILKQGENMEITLFSFTHTGMSTAECFLYSAEQTEDGIRLYTEELFSGGLIVANHQSYLDILVLASTFRIRFAPKAEMRRWPLIGFMTQCNRPVWIDRSTPSKARFSAEAMSRTMESGQAMMVFPEGTTSDGKEGLLPFKSTSFQAVIDSKSAVLPVIISYNDFCRSDVQWFGHRSFLPHVWQVLGMKKIEAVIHILEPVSPQKDEERKTLAARVYDIMNEKWRSL